MTRRDVRAIENQSVLIASPDQKRVASEIDAACFTALFVDHDLKHIKGLPREVGPPQGLDPCQPEGLDLGVWPSHPRPLWSLQTVDFVQIVLEAVELVLAVNPIPGL